MADQFQNVGNEEYNGEPNIEPIAEPKSTQLILKPKTLVERINPRVTSFTAKLLVVDHNELPMLENLESLSDHLIVAGGILEMPRDCIDMLRDLVYEPIQYHTVFMNSTVYLRSSRNYSHEEYQFRGGELGVRSRILMRSAPYHLGVRGNGGGGVSVAAPPRAEEDEPSRALTSSDDVRALISAINKPMTEEYRTALDSLKNAELIKSIVLVLKSMYSSLAYQPTVASIRPPKPNTTPEYHVEFNEHILVKVAVVTHSKENYPMMTIKYGELFKEAIHRFCENFNIETVYIVSPKNMPTVMLTDNKMMSPPFKYLIINSGQIVDKQLRLFANNVFQTSCAAIN